MLFIRSDKHVAQVPFGRGHHEIGKDFKQIVRDVVDSFALDLRDKFLDERVLINW